MPVLRVDDEIWEWLKKNARPLEDTPNSVLRRIAGLDHDPERKPKEEGVPMRIVATHSTSRTSKVGMRIGGRRVITNYGRDLNKIWKVGAHHALYHKDGNYYNHLSYFPGALFDPNGYVVFKTEEDYSTSPYLQLGEQLHVPGGISSLPGYVRMK